MRFVDFQIFVSDVLHNTFWLPVPSISNDGVKVQLWDLGMAQLLISQTDGTRSLKDEELEITVRIHVQANEKFIQKLGYLVNVAASLNYHKQIHVIFRTVWPTTKSKE